ncbi:MAG: protoporphyrinogen oxidase [Acidobacteria bacterium]|nr:protoporphyrinogen oxidase [Acidobacteriota bacterium]
MSVSSDPNNLPSIIIGGGISGLSAAYYLAKRNLPSILIESAPQLGGVIQTQSVADCLLEGGPDSFLAAKPEALTLIGELGLAGDVIGSNDHQRSTWILKNGRMLPLPDGLMMMVPTRIWPTAKSPLLSWGTKIRMGLELLHRPVANAPDRSVGEFVEDHYGREAVDYLAEPLLSGVYGGDPYQLSIQSVLPRFADMEAKYGSLTKGTLAGLAKAPKNSGSTLFKTLKHGLGSMVAAMEKSIAGHCRVLHTQAQSITREGEDYLVQLPNEVLRTRHLIVATPAWAAGKLLESLDPGIAKLLGGIGYSSSMTVGVIYDRAQVKQRFDSFGFLVPKKERRHLVACTFVDQKFNHRVPENRLLLRCFLGGAGNEAVLGWAEPELKRAVLDDIRTLLGLDVEPVAFQVSRWPRSMAQYQVGHKKSIQELKDRLKGYPLLFLAGNGYHGIGIPDCIRTGKEAADGFQN